ncbi:MAG: hypothetical protein IJP96_10285 [Synergistaceae bacterium]|nr:hypothetical protein [Synergistaceae bacterium]MBQ6738609.1 hypothetical protein [Synergistaceae bacterium]MBR0076131.1 hypothetical protein [Synergistaceae bacterium]MBR0080077.1 hypothetical protein [Synergistaceae bacterium]MBR0233990.1 hypothetical protein [Synergistaceae bacterium]
MPRATPIDRIALTKSKSKYLQAVEEMKREFPPEKNIQSDICPECGGKLERWESCYRCKKCGWSKC